MGVQHFGLFVRDLIKRRVKKGSSVVQTRRKGSLLSLPRRRAIERMEVETTLPLPNLLQPSELLSETLIRKLVLHLISRAVGHDWTLVYSTFQHGISLQTLYRKMVVMEDSPILLIVQDAEGKLFGAMVSSPLKISERFYGTGESFLFSFDEDGEISTFFWTGCNDYIVKGSPDNVAIGSGDGHFGLWLDESLYHGSSMPCATFGNSCLASTEDFIIVGLEAWGFK